MEGDKYISNVSDAFFSKLHNKDRWAEWAPYLIKLGASLVKLEKKSHKFTLGIVLPCLDFSPALVGVGYIIEKLRYVEESDLTALERIKKIPDGSLIQYVLGKEILKGISRGLKTKEELWPDYPEQYGYQIEEYLKKKSGKKKIIRTIPPNFFHTIKPLKVKNDDNVPGTKKDEDILDGITYRTKYVNKIIHEIFPKEEITNMLFNKTLCCEFFITKRYFQDEITMPFGEFKLGGLNDLLMVDGIKSNQPGTKSRIFSEKKNKDSLERPHLSIFCGGYNYYRLSNFSSENKIVMIGASEDRQHKVNAFSDINKSYSHRDKNQEFNYNLLPKNNWELEIMGFYSQSHE